MQKIKGFYDARLWTKTMVANAVLKGRITADEYQEITGEPYTAPETQTDSVDLETRVSAMETGITERIQSLETDKTDLQLALAELTEMLLEGGE